MSKDNVPGLHELIEPGVLARIQSRLKGMQSEEGVRILHACESGSRAWGFPSANSDFDVRFIYARPQEWYVSVVPGRDVIELPAEDVLDINGWDIRKALFLLRKSNPVLLEWLDSPIIYSADEALLAPLRGLLEAAFSPASAWGHYWSMARQHLAKIRGDEEVRIKHYLYTMRPLLACRWVIDKRMQPPMLFESLTSRYLTGAVADVIAELIEIKRSGEETGRIGHVPLLDEYLLSEHERMASLRPDAPEPLPMARFDEALRETLRLQEA